jgi:tripartite-type tricarboxylate transporter receptor subunit TctC
MTIKHTLTLAVGLLTSLISPALSQEAIFKGKTVEILVGFGPGGGYDAYARALGQFMGKHIPGSPTVVVRNMPGAGSLAVVNHIANALPADSLTIATFDPAQLIAPLLGEKNAKYDASKLTWIGSISDSTNVCIGWHTSDLKSWNDMFGRREPLPMGTTGPVDARHQHTAILRNMLKADLTMISGYKGSSEVRLAMERGEIAGNCGDSWSSLKSTSAQLLKEGKIKLVAQFAIESHPELKQVPLIMDQVKTDTDRAALRLILGPQVSGRPYASPPTMRPEVRDALRSAFDATMKDPEFLAFTRKIDLDVAPVSGSRIEQLVKELYQTNPESIEVAKQAIK